MLFTSCPIAGLAQPVPEGHETAATETREPAGVSTYPADLETTRAALLLLNDAVTVQADGRHHRLLRALRYLEDPSLEPLFRGLSEPTRHPSIRVHAMLGLAEIRDPAGLGLAEIAAVQEPLVQAELVAAALDAGLLEPATQRSLLGWPQIDGGLKVLLLASLDGRARRAGETDHRAGGAGGNGSSEVVSPSEDVTENVLLQALDSESPGQRGLAALVLMQRGRDAGRAVLNDLAADVSAATEPAIQVLLETIWRERMDRAAGWAWQVAQQAEQNVGTRMLALQTAMRLGEPSAIAGWRRWSTQRQAAGDLSESLRLAMVGLESSPWLEVDALQVGGADATGTGDPAAAETSVEANQTVAAGERVDGGGIERAGVEGEAIEGETVEGGAANQGVADDGLLRAIRAATHAVAGELRSTAREAHHDRQVPDADGHAESAADRQSAIEALLSTHYAPAWRWAADYAEWSDSPSLAVSILEGYRPDEARGRSRRLEAVASAVQSLAKQQPRTAIRLLPGRLTADQVDPAWSRAVLLGLLRSRSDAGPQMASKLQPLEDPAAADLRLVLQMRRGAGLDDAQLEQLRRLLEREDRLDETLRVEPAWWYLRRSGQAVATTRALLAPTAAEVQAVGAGSNNAGKIPVPAVSEP